MFFRRSKTPTPTFVERLDQARQAGFAVEDPSTRPVRLVRDGCAALVAESAAGEPAITAVGVLLGGEIASLVDVGYQKLWRSAIGQTAPARAVELHALHSFEEDLREALGLASLYNEALGTVNDSHHYDRLTDRDRGVPRRAWEQ